MKFEPKIYVGSITKSVVTNGNKYFECKNEVVTQDQKHLIKCLQNRKAYIEEIGFYTIEDVCVEVWQNGVLVDFYTITKTMELPNK